MQRLEIKRVTGKTEIKTIDECNLLIRNGARFKIVDVLSINGCDGSWIKNYGKRY